MDNLTLQSLRILIIDDVERAQGYMRYTLDALGFRNINYQSNLARAKAAIINAEYDLVFYAYTVKRTGDGYHAYQQLAQSKQIPHTTAVIFVSAETKIDIVRSIIELQPDGFIVKPFSIKQFENRVSKVLAQRTACLPALKAMQAERWQQAISICETQAEQTKYQQHIDQLLSLKGDILLHTHAWQQAKEFFTEMQQRGMGPWATLGLSRALMMLDEHQQAEKLLITFALQPSHQVIALDLLAQVQIKQQDYASAFNSLQLANELSPKHRARQQALFELARIIKSPQQQYETAKVLLELAKEATLHEPSDFLRLARSGIDYAQLLEKHEQDELQRQIRLWLQSYRRASPQQAPDINLSVIESRLFSLQDKLVQARQPLKEIDLVEFEQLPFEDLLDISKALHEAEIFDHSDYGFALLMSRIESNSNVLTAQTVRQESQQRQAIRRSPRVLNDEGINEFKRGKLDDALESFKKAFTLMPRKPSIALNLMHTIIRLGHANSVHQKTAKNTIAQCISVLQSIPLNTEQHATFTKLCDLWAQRV